MNNKLTIGGVVLLHAVAILLLTTVGGCRTSGGMDRNNDTSAYSGYPRDQNGGGYVAASASSKRGAAAQPVAEAAPVDVGHAEPVVATSEPVGAPVEPTAERAVVTKTPAAESKPVGAGRTHVVKANESLWVIAKREGVSTTALADANGLKKNATLRQGQKLVIPAATDAKGPVAGAAPVSKKASASAEAVGGDVYVVKKGDVLSIIARKLGTTSAALRAENNLKGDSIREGQKLRIPSGATKRSEAVGSKSTPAVTAAPAKGEATAAPVSGPVAAPVSGSSLGLKPLTPLGGAPVAPSAPAAAPVSRPATGPEPEVVDVSK